MAGSTLTRKGYAQYSINTCISLDGRPRQNKWEKLIVGARCGTKSVPQEAVDDPCVEQP